MKQTAAVLLTLWVAIGVTAAAAPAPRTSAILAPSPRLQLLAVRAQHASAAHAAAEPAVPMETVVHTKEAGDGYTKGSPLYKKQEAQQGANSNITYTADDHTQKQYSQYPWHYWMTYPKTMVVVHIAYILIMVAGAYIYRALKSRGHLDAASVNEEAPFPYEGDAFTYGFCDVSSCRQDWPIWLSACCCPTMRWADTISSQQAPFADFWTAFFVMIGLEVLGPLTWFGSAFLVMMVGIYFRQRLRLLFGHEPKRCKTVTLDFFAWCCCPFFAIVQEAREVERVRRKPAGQAYLPPQAH